MNNLGIIILIIFVAIFLLALLFIKPKEAKWKNTAKEKLNKLIQKQKTTDYKMLLIEADKLLDFCLKGRGIKGNTLGERLKNAKDIFEWNFYQKIWGAHKVRNKLVHEIDFQISKKELKRHYELLKKSIKKLIG